MPQRLSRRDLLALAGTAAGATFLLERPASARAEPAPAGARGFDIALNSATVRAHKLGIVKVVELAAKAGYQGVEFWLDELDDYVKGGGSPAELGKRARDLGVVFPDAIGFVECLVDDDARRAKALEEVRRRMDSLAAIGCARMAVPPAGLRGPIDLLRAAERYRAVLEVGDAAGVTPVLELWGPSPAISRLGQAVLIAMETGHPRACVLPDVYHLHKGGSDFEGFRMLRGEAIGILHLNDYPAAPPLADLRDSHRVFPGDGVAPLGKLLRELKRIGYAGMLSLELFNPEYYKRDPEEVIVEGLRKSRAVVAASVG